MSHSAASPTASDSASWNLYNPAAQRARPVPAFASESFAYTDALSASLLQDPACREFPDLIALGFWLRRASLQPLCQHYQQQQRQFKPLGLVFHNTPANVDSLFMYSGILSFLLGNVNYIRISRRAGAASLLLRQKICRLAQIFPAQNARLQLLSCEHQAPELLHLLTQLDGRVLWGSDQAITAQRQLPVPARCRDLCFVHKFSMALLDSSALLNADENQLQQLVRDFAKDNLTYGQQACSSAKALFWLGSDQECTAAQHRFWPAFATIASSKANFSDSEQYQALTTAQALAMQQSARLHLTPPLHRLQLSQLNAACLQQHLGCGLFLEVNVDSLAGLNRQLANTSAAQQQTLSYWGLPAETASSWFSGVLNGIDRLVPVGAALNFTPVWDGMDLVYQLSKVQY